VESTNRVLLRGLKRILEKAKGTWAEEVPNVGLSQHASVHHWRDTFQLGVRVERDDPNRDSRELATLSELRG